MPCTLVFLHKKFRMRILHITTIDVVLSNVHMPILNTAIWFHIQVTSFYPNVTLRNFLDRTLFEDPLVLTNLGNWALYFFFFCFSGCSLSYLHALFCSHFSFTILFWLTSQLFCQQRNLINSHAGIDLMLDAF